jgi:hypothetical protein
VNTMFRELLLQLRMASRPQVHAMIPHGSQIGIPSDGKRRSCDDRYQQVQCRDRQSSIHRMRIINSNYKCNKCSQLSVDMLRQHQQLLPQGDEDDDRGKWSGLDFKHVACMLNDNNENVVREILRLLHLRWYQATTAQFERVLSLVSIPDIVKPCSSGRYMSNLTTTRRKIIS